MPEEPLLEISNLTIDYNLAGRRMRALDQVSFSLQRGEVLGVAGESGCGKSTLALAVIGLLPRNAVAHRGEILFERQDLLKIGEERLDSEIRGQKITMIFQNPQNALNPVFTIEKQMVDVLRQQAKNGKTGKVPSSAALREKAIEQLRVTGIADPSQRITNYPFEFSGGMKQRVMIAMALSAETSLLIADEPTTALDVTIEAQINKLILDLAAEYGTSVLYVSHNLGVLSEVTQRMMVMYAGRIFEMGPTRDVLGAPRHPYSVALLESLPGRHTLGKKLLSIPGFVPSLDRLPTGCSFHPRCSFAEDICSRNVPKLWEVAPGYWSACLLDQKRGRHKWKWS